ncbi:hypothetical protein EMIHUDRAFT_448641 [Emiliania huxleyi CCMP1516]|uniref:Uncharacterized protein n=2 Tax=Emiliania huxleyi TaxID=2903 RepID=A0A0D3I2B4_EMIH1|nr:hypothetical protein EMIHUDRAFT_448641 [Emiliania huxleyi CCMP1516]EOD05399.1 hypothetical protein EMIHUDRAFT_448641 [Emiliania huxleyi CCMP1516]|eukprot:XP_005757828.1 hypothetical protein EMIHUDRAFT_448641 [Emiliania huxleyi CCMP1516]
MGHQSLDGAAALRRAAAAFPFYGPFLALLLCGARLAQSIAAARSAEASIAAARGAEGGGGRGLAPPQGGVRGTKAVRSGQGPGAASWGLLVLSDAPAVPALAARLPALAGRVVDTAGAGQLGHSSFGRSCSSDRGCSRGPDPGGAWTRSLVDFYLAGAADGFVKGLFTSFLFATMRRNLLCCEPGAFVQWMAWYNLSRTHRDHPMKDRAFMDALARTSWADEKPVFAAASSADESSG